MDKDKVKETLHKTPLSEFFERVCATCEGSDSNDGPCLGGIDQVLDCIEIMKTNRDLSCRCPR